MQKTMDYKRYDIVIIPPPDIAEQAMALSRLLVPFGSFFVLDGVARHREHRAHHERSEETRERLRAHQVADVFHQREAEARARGVGYAA